MKVANLEQRRNQRLEKRRKRTREKLSAAGTANGFKASAERKEIIDDFKKLSLKRLRALHKAAQQAFSKSKERP